MDTPESCRADRSPFQIATPGDKLRDCAAGRMKDLADLEEL